MDRVSGRSLAARLFGASPARTLALLQASWPLAVGPELARRTEVLAIEAGTLRVRVPDASWRKVLHRIQPQILGRLREIAGELAPLRMGFVEGCISGSESGVERRAAAVDAGGFQGGPQPIRPPVAAVRPPTWRGVSAPPEISAVEVQARGIADAEIRSRFVQAAQNYLARSKGRTDA